MLAQPSRASSNYRERSYSRFNQKVIIKMNRTLAFTNGGTHSQLMKTHFLTIHAMSSNILASEMEHFPTYLLLAHRHGKKSGYPVKLEMKTPPTTAPSAAPVWHLSVCSLCGGPEEEANPRPPQHPATALRYTPCLLTLSFWILQKLIQTASIPRLIEFVPTSPYSALCRKAPSLSYSTKTQGLVGRTHCQQTLLVSLELSRMLQPQCCESKHQKTPSGTGRAVVPHKPHHHSPFQK